MKICLLHRYPKDQIKQTNAAFLYLEHKGMDVRTFRKFNRLNDRLKFVKSLLWIVYAPLLVVGRGYDVIYCDDSFPFYPTLVKLVCPRAKVIIRLGDFQLMYYCKGWLYRVLHKLEKICWNKVDKIIAISEVMRDAIKLETVNPKTYVVLDPVDSYDWPSANTLKAPGQIVMFHGLLTRNKNVEMLLGAASRLPHIEFRIIGAGPHMAYLESIAPDNVKFYGWQSFGTMYSFINDCNIGVAMRSNNPGNNYVVTSPYLQYGMMGKPCLVTRRDVFGTYEWQFSNVDELISKISALLARPEEGEKLRKYVMENHDAKKIAEEIWSLLLY